jgi:serine/threonine protein kinase
VEAYGTPCDVWSLGVTLAYLLTGKHPILRPGQPLDEVTLPHLRPPYCCRYPCPYCTLSPSPPPSLLLPLPVSLLYALSIPPLRPPSVPPVPATLPPAVADVARARAPCEGLRAAARQRGPGGTAGGGRAGAGANSGARVQLLDAMLRGECASPPPLPLY